VYNLADYIFHMLQISAGHLTEQFQFYASIYTSSML
jgi:hypothetical protein